MKKEILIAIIIVVILIIVAIILYFSLGIDITQTIAVSQEAVSSSSEGVGGNIG